MASRRRQRRNRCDRKKSYPTKDEAVKHAKYMRRVHPGEIWDAYKCPYGNHFHTGHRFKQGVGDPKLFFDDRDMGHKVQDGLYGR